jgi:hypothetical protein
MVPETNSFARKLLIPNRNYKIEFKHRIYFDCINFNIEYSFSYCDYSSKQEHLLERHEELHKKRIQAGKSANPASVSAASMGGESSSVSGRRVSLPQKCPKCPAVIGSQRDYETHLGLHGSNKKFKCKVGIPFPAQ